MLGLPRFLAFLLFTYGLMLWYICSHLSLALQGQSYLQDCPPCARPQCQTVEYPLQIQQSLLHNKSRGQWGFCALCHAADFVQISIWEVGRRVYLKAHSWAALIIYDWVIHKHLDCHQPDIINNALFQCLLLAWEKLKVALTLGGISSGGSFIHANLHGCKEMYHFHTCVCVHHFECR